MAEAPRLYLITPRLEDAAAFAPLLEAALDAADVACVLIRSAARDEHGLKVAVRTLAPLIQRRGSAVLIDREPRMAARLDVDGVHVEGAGETLAEAVSALKPQKIVGAGGLYGRDVAMSAGEADVDYVMFGGPNERHADAETRDHVAWWAEIFNVPCVGYASHPDRAGEMAAAGAEFVALCEGLWDEAPIGRVLAEVSASMTRALRAIPESVR